MIFSVSALDYLNVFFKILKLSFTKVDGFYVNFKVVNRIISLFSAFKRFNGKQNIINATSVSVNSKEDIGLELNIYNLDANTKFIYESHWRLG